MSATIVTPCRIQEQIDAMTFAQLGRHMRNVLATCPESASGEYFQSLWARREQLKNKYGGYPPGEQPKTHNQT